MFKAYPSKGDKKHTSDYAGNRVSKADLYVLLMGKIDSVKAELDIARYHIKDENDREIVSFLSGKLWQTMGEISLGRIGEKVVNPITEDDVHEVERIIITLGDGPKQFVEFTTSPAIYINEARVRWRELEPLLVAYEEEKRMLRSEIFAFVNRVSDLLFLLAWKYEEKN